MASERRVRSNQDSACSGPSAPQGASPVQSATPRQRAPCTEKCASAHDWVAGGVGVGGWLRDGQAACGTARDGMGRRPVHREAFSLSAGRRMLVLMAVARGV
jgi:hypothetical protein